MTAIVAGQGLGLSNTSLGLLGEAGQVGQAAQGRGGERVYVNAATGNLVVQRQDEWLVGLGPDVGVMRTYNSVAGSTGDGDNNDNWRLGLSRKIYGLSGTANAAGSSVRRVDEGGHEAIYTWDSAQGAYICRNGGGSTDTLVYDGAGAKWLWTDGDTRTVETYAITDTGTKDARLTQITDRDGKTLTLSYNDSGYITQILDASGESVYLDYNGSTGQISQVRTVTSATSTRVHYTYDGSGRLSRVTVDLTPEDNSVDTGPTYVTDYTYDDAVTPGTKRLKTITQADGSTLTFDYDSSARISKVTEKINGQDASTSFTYTTGKTTVTDALERKTELTYDITGYTGANAKAGQLLSVSTPVVHVQNGSTYDVQSTTQFTYDSKGNVETISDARGYVSRYRYDPSGNRTYERDGQGNVIERTFNAASQVLSETRYTVAAPDGDSAGQPSTPLTTRYVYDAKGHLRFVISPEGRVTENTYNNAGQLTSTVQYTEQRFNLAGLASWSQNFDTDTSGFTPTTLPLGITRTTGSGGDGVLAVTSQYSTTMSNASLVGPSKPVGTNWRMEIKPTTAMNWNSLYVGLDSGASGTSSYRRYSIRVHKDGLVYAEGLVGTSAKPVRNIGAISTGKTYVVELDTQPDGGVQIYIYEQGKERSSGLVDAQIISDENGTVTRHLYDSANRLKSVEVAPTDLSLKTEYRFDAKGQRIWVKDANNVWTQTEYDLKGRVTATVVDPKRTPDWVSGGDNNPSGLALRTEFTYDDQDRQLTVIEGAGSLQPKKTRYVYDAAGRRTQEIVDPDGLALTTSYTYDKNDNVITKMDAGLNVTRYVYDKQNRLIYTVAPNGGVTENTYDANGRLTRTRQYAQPIAQDKGVRIWYKPGNNSSADAYLGRFAEGDVITAMARALASGSCFTIASTIFFIVDAIFRPPSRLG